MEINPYSTEIRYTLDYMVFTLMNCNPTSIRVATDSLEMAKSVVRRLPIDRVQIYVNSEEIRQKLSEEFGIETRLFHPQQGPVDAVLLPFCTDHLSNLNGEKWVIGSTFNAVSYKSILHPGLIRSTFGQVTNPLKNGYKVNVVAALYSPLFILLYTLARFVERWSSSLYFQIESFAMARLLHFGWLWRFSYIVIYTGRYTGQGQSSSYQSG